MIFHLTDSERLVYAAALARWVSVETVDGNRMFGTHLGEQLTGGVRAAYNAVFAMRAGGDAIKAGRIERDDDAAHDMFLEFTGKSAAPNRDAMGVELVPNEPGLDWKALATELAMLARPLNHARVEEIVKIVHGDAADRRRRTNETLVGLFERQLGLGHAAIAALRKALGIER